MMKRFAFNLTSGKNFVKLDEPLVTHSASKMVIRNVDVYWECKNIFQNTVVNYGTDITFTAGYWSFEDIQKKLKESDVTLSLNSHDNTCSVFGEDHPVKLGNLGSLLGFDNGTTVAANTKTTSSKKVNINLGVKFLNIECNLVRFSNNYFNGKRSQVIACVPLTTDQKLFGSVSHYSERYCQIPLYNGTFNEIFFGLETDNRKDFGNANILLEVEIR